jgi:TRAP-type C4-dicarboxylate transport system permease small subunit
MGGRWHEGENMTPLSFEWQWSSDYLIFMGFLYLALAVAGCGLVVAYVRSWLDLYKEKKIESHPPSIPSRSRYTDY